MFGTDQKGIFSEKTRIFLTIGVLGDFTTMSTLNYETFKLIEQNETGLVFANVLGNVFIGLFAIYLGKIVATEIWS